MHQTLTLPNAVTTPPYDSRTQPLTAPLPSAVGEAQRAYVIKQLSEAFANDRLSMEQLDDRLARVYEATSVAALEQLLVDLDSPTTRADAPAGYMRVAQDFAIPERAVGVAVMGGYQRGAGWVVPRQFKAIAVMGGIELDLREARLAPGVTEIEVYAFWGGAEILVPDGVRVECVGMAIMGGFSASSGAANLDDPNVPVLRISGFVVMGGVEIKRKEPKRENERRFVQALEKAERMRPRRGSDGY